MKDFPLDDSPCMSTGNIALVWLFWHQFLVTDCINLRVLVFYTNCIQPVEKKPYTLLQDINHFELKSIQALHYKRLRSLTFSFFLASECMPFLILNLNLECHELLVSLCVRNEAFLQTWTQYYIFSVISSCGKFHLYSCLKVMRKHTVIYFAGLHSPL
jgi:hypothetical protein